MPDLMSTIGRLHPLLVHLPIGILLTGILLQWLSRKENNHSFKGALKPVYFVGCIAAILSCITGYLLSLDGGYDKDILQVHQWMGIAIAFIAVCMYLGIAGLRWLAGYTHVVATLLFAGILYTGHLGGTLTHGSDYLFTTKGPQMEETTFVPISNVQEAVVYDDIIKPILQSKCYACHGAEKQKGKLRLDSKEYILKGGKNGQVISGDATEPELVYRILLPPDDDDHMPPKEKGQLTHRQKMLLQWWIHEGANFTAKSKSLTQNDTIKKLLVSLQGIEQDKKNEAFEISYPVMPAPAGLVDSLKKVGVIVLPLSAGVTALSVNLLNVTKMTDTIWSQLSRLNEHVYSLKAEGPAVNDESMKTISSLASLRKLSLANTMVTDSGIQRINNLRELISLNITGTAVTANGLMAIEGLPNLTWLYLFRSRIKSSDLALIKQRLPGINIDSGGYAVPFLATDTQVVKPKKS